MSNADNDAKDYYHQTDPQYKLRWPLELKEKIAQSAKEHNRSMNADIIARLEESFTETNMVASDPYKRMLLAVIAGIIAEQADREKPSFKEAIDRIVKAVLVDEKSFQNMISDIKKAP